MLYLLYSEVQKSEPTMYFYLFIFSFKGPLRRIYRDLTAEMEYDIQKHVFICE